MELILPIQAVKRQRRKSIRHSLKRLRCLLRISFCDGVPILIQ